MDQQLFLRPTSVIMQPETLCNLDCTYCYLPFRHERNTMKLAVAQAVAASVRPWAASGTVEVCWHGGEPLATGRAHLGRLMDAFAGIDVKHVVQTNATLIDDAWCEFFAERDLHVGVSIDGAPADNTSRVDRRQMPTQAKAVRGIELLRAHGHEVHAIAVVSDPTPERARRLYAFAVECGIAHLGVNIEEQEGVNVSTNAHRQDVVTDFWTTLAASWRENPAVRVRELERALSYAGAVLRRDSATHRDETLFDPLPTVGHDGSVTLISPELAGFNSNRGTFSSGKRTAKHPGRDHRAIDIRRLLGLRVRAGSQGLPAHMPVLRLLRRRTSGQPLLRARPHGWNHDQLLPEQQDFTTGGSATP
ncbi:radical SAM protein [Lentzea sp. NPDC004789]